MQESENLIKNILFPFVLLLLNLIGTFLIQKYIKGKEARQQNYQKAQVEKLQELYSLMVEFKFVNTMVFNTDNDTDNPLFKRKMNTWINRFISVRSFYEKNRILFPLNICTKLDKKFKELRELGLKLQVHKSTIEENEQYEYEILEYWDEIDRNNKTINQILEDYNYLIAGIDDIIREIEADFRKII